MPKQRYKKEKNFFGLISNKTVSSSSSSSSSMNCVRRRGRRWEANPFYLWLSQFWLLIKKPSERGEKKGIAMNCGALSLSHPFNFNGCSRVPAWLPCILSISLLPVSIHPHELIMKRVKQEEEEASVKQSLLHLIIFT